MWKHWARFQALIWLPSNLMSVARLFDRVNGGRLTCSVSQLLAFSHIYRILCSILQRSVLSCYLLVSLLPKMVEVDNDLCSTFLIILPICITIGYLGAERPFYPHIYIANIKNKLQLLSIFLHIPSSFLSVMSSRAHWGWSWNLLFCCTLHSSKLFKFHHFRQF